MWPPVARGLHLGLTLRALSRLRAGVTAVQPQPQEPRKRTPSSASTGGGTSIDAAAFSRQLPAGASPAMTPWVFQPALGGLSAHPQPAGSRSGLAAPRHRGGGRVRVLVIEDDRELAEALGVG